VKIDALKVTRATINWSKEKKNRRKGSGEEGLVSWGKKTSDKGEGEEAPGGKTKKYAEKSSSIVKE